ncbi:MAG: YciI family protein [Chloroflexota bacterium]
MAQYILSYIGGNQPSSKDAGKEHHARYSGWLSSLGEAVVVPAQPFKDTQIVSPDGTVSEGSKTNMSGYTIIEAESMEKALEIAKDCPFLDIGGTLEVSELMQM